MNGLTGKIAVITGGTRGLGAAITRLFADRGASAAPFKAHIYSAICSDRVCRHSQDRAPSAA
jgi:hypothetical protein